MTNFTLGAFSVGLLSVGVVGISLKVALTYLKPQFDRNFRHLEFANGTIYTQTELNTQMLTHLGREVGKIQDTISLLIGQLEDVKSSYDLSEHEGLSRSSSSCSLDGEAGPSRRRTSSSSSSASLKRGKAVVVEDDEEESEEEEEEEEEIIQFASSSSSPAAAASASASASSTATDSTSEKKFPSLSSFNIFASRSPASTSSSSSLTSSSSSSSSSSSQDRGKGRLVSRRTTSTALTLPTDNSNRIEKMFQMAQEKTQEVAHARFEKFEAMELQLSQTASSSSSSSISTTSILSSMAKGLSSTVTNVASSVAPNAAASGQVGLVNNQYYGLVHFHGSPSVPDFLNIGKFLTSFVRTGLFSVFHSIVI